MNVRPPDMRRFRKVMFAPEFSLFSPLRPRVSRLWTGSWKSGETRAGAICGVDWSARGEKQSPTQRTRQQAPRRIWLVNGFELIATITNTYRCRIAERTRRFRWHCCGGEAKRPLIVD
jgi:hypothetical protein